MWLLADSEHAYVLKCYIYEEATYGKLSSIAGAGYDVVYCLMETGKLTIVIICLRAIYLQPMQQQIICWNEALL